MNKKDNSSQILPEQAKFFQTEKLKKSTRAGTHLPDPTIAPYGYDPNTQFRHIFPELNLPILNPPHDLHPDDNATFGHPDMPKNKLFFGDNLYVMRNLPSESIDLIYIDPPFFSNRDYVQIWGDDNEVRSFQDIFGDGMFSYLAWLNARLWEMKRLLKPTGSIYVHCDWHAAHYIKCEMDKIFGYDNFQNEISWCYATGGASKERFSKKHDSIFFYAKDKNKKLFNMQKERDYYEKPFIDTKIEPPKFQLTTKNIKEIITSINDKKPVKDSFKKELFNSYYADVIMKDYWKIPAVINVSKERIGYPTQKPESLLERIIFASSKEGDVVSDFFMGGGTTAAVAIKNKRTFIGSDISRVAVSVTYNRLVEISENISGIDASEKAVARLQLEDQPMPDIEIGYVGSYPINKFEGIGQDEFEKFVIDLYEAMPYTGEHESIKGTSGEKVVVCVGPSSPKERVKIATAKKALEDTIRAYNNQLAMGDEKIIHLIGWSFEPMLQQWKGQAIAALNKKGLKIQIELIGLASESFRQKIFRDIGERNIDLKFNKLNQLLSFTHQPNSGSIISNGNNGLTVKFELIGAQAIGAGGRLINCQWDFDYLDNRFSEKKYALNRKKMKGGEYEAVLSVEHTFKKYGEHLVAARLQDNQDGESTTVAKVYLTNDSIKIEAVENVKN